MPSVNISTSRGNKSHRDDILVAKHYRNGMSRVSDGIVMVEKNGIPKIKTISSLRDLIAGLGTVSTNMSSLRDLCAKCSIGLIRSKSITAVAGNSMNRL